MTTPTLKEKLVQEMSGYLVNFLYLTLFFCIFTLYRRLLLAEYSIGYSEYGISIIKALILAKVIMLGEMLRLGRRMQEWALIVRVLYKTVVFTLWVALFRILEIAAVSIYHGAGLSGFQHELLGRSPYEMVAHALIVFVAFIPFFTLRELTRVLGKKRMSELFFLRPD